MRIAQVRGGGARPTEVSRPPALKLVRPVEVISTLPSLQEELTSSIRRCDQCGRTGGDALVPVGCRVEYSSTSARIVSVFVVRADTRIPASRQPQTTTLKFMSSSYGGMPNWSSLMTATHRQISFRMVHALYRLQNASTDTACQQRCRGILWNAP
jgi:hypothetical protein